MPETDVELQKLEVLKRMAAKVDVQPTPDALTAFGNQVVLELRQIQDPGYLARLKKNIMVMINDAHETERNRSFSSHRQVISAPPLAQSHPCYSSTLSPHPTFLQTLQDNSNYERL